MFHKFRQLIRFHKTIITVFSFFYICKIKIWHTDLADFSRRLYSSDSLKVSKTLQKKRSKKKKRNYLAPIVVEILFCFFFKILNLIELMSFYWILFELNFLNKSMYDHLSHHFSDLSKIIGFYKILYEFIRFI